MRRIRGLSSWYTVAVDLTTQTNYNLYTFLQTKGWSNTSKKLRAFITIPSGVVIYSNNPSTPAFTVGNQFRSYDILQIINNGSIIGSGGASGAGGSTNGNPGGTGGTAISLSSNCYVYNQNGIIYGGGGGGGGNGGTLVTGFNCGINIYGCGGCDGCCTSPCGLRCPDVGCACNGCSNCRRCDSGSNYSYNNTGSSGGKGQGYNSAAATNGGTYGNNGTAGSNGSYTGGAGGSAGKYIENSSNVVNGILNIGGTKLGLYN